MTSWLITGSNRGIGLPLTRQLSTWGGRVIAVCRTASAELDALGVSIEAGVELSSEVDLAAGPGLPQSHPRQLSVLTFLAVALPESQC